MHPDNDRVRDDRGYCLVSTDKEHFVLFVEDADSVTVDLSSMPASQPCAAVDAKAEYEEIDKGNLSAGVHTIHLGKTSDWALAVGDFGKTESLGYSTLNRLFWAFVGTWS